MQYEIPEKVISIDQARKVADDAFNYLGTLKLNEDEIKGYNAGFYNYLEMLGVGDRFLPWGLTLYMQDVYKAKIEGKEPSLPSDNFVIKKQTKSPLRVKVFVSQIHNGAKQTTSGYWEDGYFKAAKFLNKRLSQDSEFLPESFSEYISRVYKKGALS